MKEFMLKHPFITFLIVDEIACHIYNAYNHTIELKYKENVYGVDRKKGIIGNLVGSANERLKKTNNKLEDAINETEN